ncbi:MAG: L-histidine N(alpha)-methyltransferase [archaeon]|nr:L-histidine N(alpha)-methyltransferase [archaeon]
MQVNDLIFKELIKRGYSLEGKTRVWNIADSKLWYLTPEQAQAFLDLEKSGDYQKDVIQKEIDLIKENINNIVKKLNQKPVNIIDLGCGDGKKAVIFINYLEGKVKLRYCPIDISDYMIGKALDRIKKLNVGEVVEFQWNVSDFENLENVSQLLKRGNFKNNFILLLGNTLGNFEINELLYEIRSSMAEGDFLLIGNGLDTRNQDDVLKAYDNAYLDELLVKTLTQIGLKKEDVQYGARFRNSRIEMYYTIKKNTKITFLDKPVYFNAGDQIIVAVSYKYDEENFRKYVKMYFDDVKVYVSDDKSYALAMCKR